MSEEKKEEIITELVEDYSSPDDKKPAKKLSFITKFFLFAFTVLLVFHFVTNWFSAKKIEDQSSEIVELNKTVNDLKLLNQELRSKVGSFEVQLKKAKTNLEFVDSDRVKKAGEIEDLKNIVSTLKVNIPKGSQLIIERLEQKLLSWENYYKSLDETIKNRPGN